MNDINWNQLANNAANQTDSQLTSQMASLTNLKLTEIESFISESNITNENALKVLQIVASATMENNQKASDIETIENGVAFLVKLAGKVV